MDGRVTDYSLHAQIVAELMSISPSSDPFSPAWPVDVLIDVHLRERLHKKRRKKKLKKFSLGRTPTQPHFKTIYSSFFDSRFAKSV